jgi:sterol desaturase/sphingolipid hydroxylase (fatty acid hydroxylase superfamily)
MDFIYSLKDLLSAPIISIFAAPWQREYILFLLANGIIAYWVYRRRARRPTLRGALRYCFPRRIFTHPSAMVDYKAWVINGILLVLITPALAGVGLGFYTMTLAAIRAVTGVDGYHGTVSAPWVVFATIVDLLAIDATLFFAHYAFHKVPLLWEFHKTHHSAKVLTPFTVFRVHPVEMTLTAALGVALSSMVGACLVFAFDSSPGATVLGLNAFQFAFYIVGYHLRHSHVWIMFPGWIGRQISSPALHHIHHSSDPRHFDKNMAQMFTFWDRMFGTLYLPTEQETLTFGLGKGHDREFDTLSDIYFRAFRVLARRPNAIRRPDGNVTRV